MNFYNNYISNPLNQEDYKVKIKDLRGINSDDLAQIMLKIAHKSSKISNADNKTIKAFKVIHNKFVESCRKWCDVNIDDANKLTNEACVYQVLDVLSNGIKKQILTNAIKKSVAEKFSPKNSYSLEKCIRTIKRLNAPVLTTNFDTYISNSVEATQKTLKNGLYKFTDFYPWNMYYSDKTLTNPLDGFAVWHINGTQNYHRSIRLGLSDYMGCVERARTMIQSKNLNEYFSGKNQKNWKGYNTWLHIVFNKNLFIFGLGLEENEVFLRWLLIQRRKYSKIYNKDLRGWYINKNISNGKKFFLEQLGFEVIEISNYDDLYSVFIS